MMVETLAIAAVVAVAALAAIAGFAAGRWHGRREAFFEAVAASEAAAQKREDVERDVKGRSDEEIARDLAKWNRD